MQQLSWKKTVIFAGAIDCIADHRTAKMGHMNPDLMRSPGLDSKFNQTECDCRIPPSPASAGGMPSSGLTNRHFLTLYRMTADWSDDTPGFFFQNTMQQGQVFFL